MPVKLCIDPGHGLGNERPGINNPGAVSGGLSEADVVLAYALATNFVLREKLRSSGGPALGDALCLLLCSRVQELFMPTRFAV